MERRLCRPFFISALCDNTHMYRQRAAYLLPLVSLALAHAEGPCARCHPAETAAFERSPMGRSVSPPSAFTEGRIVHKLSGSTIAIHRSGSMLGHRLERGGLVADYPVALCSGPG